MVVDKLGNSFSRVAIARYDGSARVALFVDLWKYVKTTSLVPGLDERYLSVSESIRLSLCRRLVYSLTRSCTLLVRSDDCFW